MSSDPDTLDDRDRVETDADEPADALDDDLVDDDVVDDDVVDDDDAKGPLLQLRESVGECYGIETSYLSAALLMMLALVPITTGLAWHRSWCTGGQALGLTALGWVVVPVLAVIFSALYDGITHKTVSWPLSMLSLAAVWVGAVHVAGGTPTEGGVLAGLLTLGFAVSTVGFRVWYQRQLQALAVPAHLAEALAALPVEPTPPMLSDLDEAVRGFIDVRDTVRGPLKGEPGVAGETMLADAAVVLTAALERAPAVDRLLTRATEGDTADEVWFAADQQWRALIDELNGTAEALLSYATLHDEASRHDLAEHQAHLSRLKDAHTEMADRLPAPTPGA